MDWISVKERLPNETDYYPSGQKGDVLILLKDETTMMGKYISEKRFQIYWQEGLGEEDDRRKIAHWMPLPEPPKP